MGTGREWRVFWQRVEFVRRPPRKTALPALDSEPRDVGSSQVKCDDEGDNPLCRSAKGSWAGIVLLVESKKKNPSDGGLVCPGSYRTGSWEGFGSWWGLFFSQGCMSTVLAERWNSRGAWWAQRECVLINNEWMNELMLIHAHYEQLPCAKSKKGFHWQRDRSLMARGSLGTFSDGFAEEAVASGIRSRPWCA